MPIHTFERTQRLRTTLDIAWKYFSNPGNLARITPDALHLRPLTPLPEEIYPGLRIRYRVRPLLRIPMTWLSEITHVTPRESFVDEQRQGPYRLWHHEHRFREIHERSVEMTDRVTYQLRFGWLGDALFHRWLVAPQLKRIFDHRERVVGEMFG